MPAINHILHPDAVIHGAIYARVSLEEKQDQPGFSLPGQINDCLKYAETYGIQVAPEHIFQDDFTGKSMHRPDMDNLMDLLPTGKIQALIVPRIDRLGRDAAEMFPFMKRLRLSRVQLCLVGTPPGQETEENRLLFGMLAMFADYDHANTLKRMEQGRRNRAMAGYPRKQKPTYGYRWVEELLPDGRRYEQAEKKRHVRGYYAIEPEEAAIVQQIFHWYTVDGWSSHRITRELNRLGIPTITTRRGYARLPNAVEHWCAPSVIHILQNRDYLGIQIYGQTTRSPKKANGKPGNQRPTAEETWIPVTIPPIIDPEVFQQAQDRFAHNKQWSARNRKHVYQFGEGRLTCGVCKRHMGGLTESNSGRTYYKCNRQRGSLSSSCCRCLSGKKLDSIFWASIREKFSEPALAMQLYTTQAQTAQAQRPKAVQHEREALEKEQRQLAFAIKRLDEAYFADPESYEPAEYAEKRKGYKKEQHALATRLLALQAETKQDQLWQAHEAERWQVLETIAELLRTMQTLEEKIRLLRLLRAKVIYQDDKTLRIDVEVFPAVGKNIAIVTRSVVQSHHNNHVWTWTTAA